MIFQKRLLKQQKYYAGYAALLTVVQSVRRRREVLTRRAAHFRRGDIECSLSFHNKDSASTDQFLREFDKSHNFSK